MNITQMWESVDNVYLQALIILGGAAAVAFLVEIIFTRIIIKFTGRTKTEIDDRIISALRRPIFYSILFAGLNASLSHLRVPERASFYTSGIISTVIIIFWIRAFLAISKITIKKLSENADRWEMITKSTVLLFDNVAKVIIVGFGIYFILISWNIKVTAFLASAGIVGIALGFAAKDTLANLFGGVFVLADKPYEIGDFVVLDSGEKGIVMDIGIRSTRLKTRDDIEITIPNAIMANTKITNESGPRSLTRVRVEVGVAYGSDLDQVKDILCKIAEENEQVAEFPEPRARFREFGSSSLNFHLLCWVEEPILRGRVTDYLNTEIYKRFSQFGIEIPFPQRDIHIKKALEKEDNRS